MLLFGQHYLLIMTGESASWMTSDESKGILFGSRLSALKTSFGDNVDLALVDTMSNTRQTK